MFQSFLWAQLAARMFAAAETPYVVLAENDSGLALIPAAIRAGGTGLTLLGETLFDYRDVIQIGDRAVLRTGWAEVAATKLPLSFTALRGEGLDRWDEFVQEPFAKAPSVLRSQASSEEFRVAHSRLGRQIRRLAKHGATLRRYDGTASRLIRSIYEHKARQPQGAIFADPNRREFMVRVAGAESQACDIFTYETVTEIVAALVTFRHAQTRHFYTIYFEPAWATYSPGQVLVYEVTALTLAEGLDCDFMTGEQPYKLRLATSSVPLFQVSASAERIAELSDGSRMSVSEVAA